ncbi:TetR/AcrR family transcriptional regulator [Streptomyces sp. NPDC017260]|uniref:TetR/AcrR family transcriptional regulator n=1 Tax=unclassified Streptomyces TaxID=2593676 RepID=UPI0037B50D2D
MTGRRRGAELERALLDAAWAELTENGYAGFTMDSVAARAGTSPPVLYRRWSNRHELLHATIRHAAHRTPLVTPDTGSLRGDVLALMRHANETRTELVAVLSVHLGGYYHETGASPVELRDVMLGGRLEAVEAIYQQAAARGEIDPDRLTERLKMLPFDLLRAEFLMVLRPLPDSTLEEIVDTVFLPLAQPGAGPKA